MKVLQTFYPLQIWRAKAGVIGDNWLLAIKSLYFQPIK
jgi:hypothetical protein